MKNVLFAALATGLLASAASVQAHDEDMEPMRDFDGIYGGSYVCKDGEHGFYLDLLVVRETEEGFDVAGTLGLFPTLAGAEGSSADATGSFAVTGTISGMDYTINLSPGEWKLKPDFYGAAGLVGTLEPAGDHSWQITGKPVVPGQPDFCSDLIATQFLPE
ncbi:hypothetical protein [Pontixanthobacter aquaemixtae]|uniref:Uncharacterized protein n=1 Tax=Pontixanthobacter aquaemixtae TaxID=1958940 RepID=A0A845A2K5_9SPHN|nr:hypothetical protein [Pontixanthobacter aquaemixtae]MXO91859.1 hypothetical protein [Pontixanthobacter aquaemixtae]